MRRLALVAACTALLSLGSAHAALQTDAYDPVEVEVTARDAALTGDTKTDVKLRRTYAKVLRLFEKRSTSRKKDAKAIKKINALLGKAWAGDDAGLELLDSALDAFLDEINAELVQCARCNERISDGNKFGPKARQTAEDAAELMDLARKGETLKLRTKWMVKLEKSAAKAHGFSIGGLEREDGLSATSGRSSSTAPWATRARRTARTATRRRSPTSGSRSTSSGST